MPQNVGILAESATSAEVDVAWFAFSGPSEPSSHCPVQNMIQLSMIVTTTSWAPTVAFRKPGDAREQRTREAGRGDRENDVREVRHAREGRAHPDRGERAGDVLALAADVEQAAAERERDGQAGEHQGRRQQQRLLERVGVTRLEAVGVPREPDLRVRARHDDVVAPRVEEPAQAAPVEDRLVRRERVVAGGDDDDEAADQEGQQRRDQRDDEAARPLERREARGDARCVAAGLLLRRSSEGGTVGSLTRRPRRPRGRRRSWRCRASRRRRRARTRRRCALRT